MFFGVLGVIVDSWRKWLICVAVLFEVMIDFVDEDVFVDVVPEVCDLL